MLAASASELLTSKCLVGSGAVVLARESIK